MQEVRHFTSDNLRPVAPEHAAQARAALTFMAMVDAGVAIHPAHPGKSWRTESETGPDDAA